MSVLPWNEFIRLNLLETKVVHGVLLITKTGQVVYSYGELQGPNVEAGNLQQFIQPFQRFSQKDNTEFNLVLKTGEKVDFKVYEQTNCSLYGASACNKHVITVCNLPYGILVCTFHHPIITSKAIAIIERFCDMMRA